jgi:hypothetical protein
MCWVSVYCLSSPKSLCITSPLIMEMSTSLLCSEHSIRLYLWRALEGHRDSSLWFQCAAILFLLCFCCIMDVCYDVWYSALVAHLRHIVSCHACSLVWNSEHPIWPSWHRHWASQALWHPAWVPVPWYPLCAYRLPAPVHLHSRVASCVPW